MTAGRSDALPSWKYGGCCSSPRLLKVTLLYVGHSPFGDCFREQNEPTTNAQISARAYLAKEKIIVQADTAFIGTIQPLGERHPSCLKTSTG
jgi:hypothetical protein